MLDSGSPFRSLRRRTGMSPEQVADEFGVSVVEVRAWEAGHAFPPERIVRTLELVGSFAPTAEDSEGRFDFIDLFAGIGGLRRGFEPLGGRCVFTSEWDKYSQKTYLANHECDHDVAGDITKVPLDHIPAHDLLLAGFPCQPFSIAGVSKKNALNRPHGFRCEAQGTLFFNVAQIIEHHRPRASLLENVKNLVNHDRGRTFEVTHRTLTEELGYQVQWKVINAKSFVPNLERKSARQRREATRRPQSGRACSRSRSFAERGWVSVRQKSLTVRARATG